jgi:hypothetical protein
VRPAAWSPCPALGCARTAPSPGNEPGESHSAERRRVEVTRCPWCETPSQEFFRFCPKCGRSLAALRIYRELTDHGLDEREVRAMLVRAGFEPF